MMQSEGKDPLAMIRQMWGSMGFGLPGIVVPTFDVAELEKRITDLKAVEGWLSMNLSMLQMTIRNMEMQVGTIRAVQTMGEMASNAAQVTAESLAATSDALKRGGEAKEADGVPPEQGAAWPWAMVQQMQEYVQRQANAASAMADAVGTGGGGTSAGDESPPKRKRKTS